MFPLHFHLPLFSATLSLTFFPYYDHFLSFIHFYIISSFFLVCFSFPIFHILCDTETIDCHFCFSLFHPPWCFHQTWEEREKFWEAFSFILISLVFSVPFLHVRKLAAHPGEVIRAMSVLSFGVPGPGTKHWVAMQRSGQKQHLNLSLLWYKEEAEIPLRITIKLMWKALWKRRLQRWCDRKVSMWGWGVCLQCVTPRAASAYCWWDFIFSSSQLAWKYGY